MLSIGTYNPVCIMNAPFIITYFFSTFQVVCFYACFSMEIFSLKCFSLNLSQFYVTEAPCLSLICFSFNWGKNLTQFQPKLFQLQLTGALSLSGNLGLLCMFSSNFKLLNLGTTLLCVLQHSEHLCSPQSSLIVFFLR